MSNTPLNHEGILLVNKSPGVTSFHLVRLLRRALKVKKIGHTGTLDPFASGLMVLLIGRPYTKLSDRFLHDDKEYETVFRLGVSTDSFDCDGEVQNISSHKPTIEEIEEEITSSYQGWIEQIPPMFSAKKINGQKLYTLARKGKEVERKPAKVHLKTTIVSYNYPHLTLHIECSKGTYIRSIADSLGSTLGCGAHVSDLRRTRCGQFAINDSIDQSMLETPDSNLSTYLRHGYL